MNLPPHTRDSVSAILRRIRSKAIDTEKLLLLNQLKPEQLLDRMDQIDGLVLLAQHAAREQIAGGALIRPSSAA